MRKCDPFNETGQLCFRMRKSEGFAIRSGTLVTIDERSGFLRRSGVDEPVASFEIPSGATVEGMCISWQQSEPVQRFKPLVVSHDELSTFQLAERIGSYLPVIERAIAHSEALEKRERNDALETSERTFVPGPHSKHRGILRRLRDDLSELLRRLRWDARQT